MQSLFNIENDSSLFKNQGDCGDYFSYDAQNATHWPKRAMAKAMGVSNATVLRILDAPVLQHAV